MSDDTTKRRYHAFKYDEYEAGGGMYDYFGSFDSLDAVLDASPEQRDLIEPRLHASYEEHGRLLRWDYKTRVITVDNMRVITWFWQGQTGQQIEIQTQTQYWHPIDPQDVLRSLGLEPGQGVTGYIPPGQWENDPL